MMDAGRFAEEVRKVVLQSGVDDYEDAAMQGLCCEGAWEVALTAMRRLDLRHLTSEYQQQFILRNPARRIPVVGPGSQDPY